MLDSDFEFFFPKRNTFLFQWLDIVIFFGRFQFHNDNRATFGEIFIVAKRENHLTWGPRHIPEGSGLPLSLRYRPWGRHLPNVERKT